MKTRDDLFAPHAPRNGRHARKLRASETSGATTIGAVLDHGKIMHASELTGDDAAVR